MSADDPIRTESRVPAPAQETRVGGTGTGTTNPHTQLDSLGRIYRGIPPVITIDSRSGSVSIRLES